MKQAVSSISPRLQLLHIPQLKSAQETVWSGTQGFFYQLVNIGNLMAVIALFLCQLALAHQVHFTLENPPDSHMFHFLKSFCSAFMTKLFTCQDLHPQIVHWCTFDDSPEPQLQKVYKWLARFKGIYGVQGAPSQIGPAIYSYWQRQLHTQRGWAKHCLLSG